MTELGKTPETQKVRAEESSKELLGCRVLFVDDDETLQKAARDELRTAGARVETAGDGRSGIRQVQQQAKLGTPFDVILIDTQVLDPDGYTAVAVLRARGVKTPIIALTASATDEDRVRCMEIGCDEYLAKPVDWAQLRSVIAQSTVSSESGVTTESGTLDERTILLVEDHVDAAAAIAILLKPHGIETTLAHTGRQAIERVAECAPDAVLLDIGLPDLDGRAVAAQLRIQGYTGALIALSGRSGTDEVQRSMEAGFDHHVVKPPDITNLVSLIASSPRVTPPLP